MNFNIYLDDATGSRLVSAAAQTGETRNALIRKAIGAWLGSHTEARWPDAVRDFKGMADMPPFESGRRDLTAPGTDPLA